MAVNTGTRTFKKESHCKVYSIHSVHYYIQDINQLI